MFRILSRAGLDRRPAGAPARTAAAGMREAVDAAREAQDASRIRPPGRFPSARRRSRAAAGRLEAALRGFERSIVALRKAALDHVDSQNLASLTLRLFLDRRTGPGRPA